MARKRRYSAAPECSTGGSSPDRSQTVTGSTIPTSATGSTIPTSARADPTSSESAPTSSGSTPTSSRPPPTDAPPSPTEELPIPTLAITVRNRNGFWDAPIIDEQGNTSVKRMKVTDVFALVPGLKVVVQVNENGQPIEEGGGLFDKFLAHLAGDFVLFPIRYRDWRKIPSQKKINVYDSIIKMGERWREARGRLYNEFYKSTCSRAQNIENCPKGIDKDQWTLFIDYRQDPAIKRKAKINSENSRKQIPHTGGSQKLAIRSHELQKKGITLSRGKMWALTHKRKDSGEYVNEQAKECAEKILQIEQEDETTRVLSSKDSLSQVLGEEHDGRVHGLGFGPTPTSVFGHSKSRNYVVVSSSSRNPHLDAYVQQLKDAYEGEKAKVKICKNVQRAMGDFMKSLYAGLGRKMPAEYANLLASLPAVGGGPILPTNRNFSVSSHNMQNDEEEQNDHNSDEPGEK